MLLSFSFITCFPALSRADAIYNAIALVDLSITKLSSNFDSVGTDPVDLWISTNANEIDEGAFIEDTAFADHLANTRLYEVQPNNLGLGHGLSQESIATEEATLRTAVSFAFSQGFLSIDNLSFTNSYTIDFKVDFSSLVDVEATNSDLQFAATESVITLESTLIGTVLDGTVSLDSDFGEGLLTDEGNLLFSIHVAPGKSDVLILSAHTAGAATSVAPVPESSTLAIFGLGLLSTTLVQWRKSPSRPR